MSALHVAIWLVTGLAFAAAMEPWAGLLHRHFWHRSLWRVHRSHHRPRPGRWEANDWLSLLHAPIAIAMILYGCAAEPSLLREASFGAGLGMTVFGVAYALVHDGLIHGRLPVGPLARSAYLARVRAAHEVHHQGRRGGAPFGLFLGPWELARQARRRPAQQPVPGLSKVGRESRPGSVSA